MRTIRMNVFETNSSSCHVMTVMNEEQLAQFDKKWNERRNVYPCHRIRRPDSDSNEAGMYELIDDDTFFAEMYPKFEQVAKTIDKDAARKIMDMLFMGKPHEDILKEFPTVNKEELEMYDWTYVCGSSETVNFCESYVEGQISAGNGKFAVLISIAC